jgi:N6-adenosine-specific RNA methylase IME4
MRRKNRENMQRVRGRKAANDDWLTRVSESDIIAEAKRIRTEKWNAKHQAFRDNVLARSQRAKINPFGVKQQYPVILCDPPWRFIGHGDRSPEVHYPTLSLPEILALPVEKIADEDAALFLWSPSALLPDALKVMQTWGFEYPSNMAWVKDRPGMGYYFRTMHETLLLGLRGKMRPPLPANRLPSVLQAPRTKHSAKPTDIYQIIETMYPDFARIELFARNRHKDTYPPTPKAWRVLTSR